MYMKLIESKNAYYELTGIASTVNRQLGFVGIAIIWIFCNLSNGQIIIPNELILPAIFIVLSLGFDLLQYLVGGIVWGCFHRYHETKVENDDSIVNASRFLNYPQNTFFAFKFILMIFSYYLLIKFLILNLTT